MSRFRSGTFSRDHIPRGLHRFTPSEALTSLEMVDLVALKGAGKELVMLDVDNTLVPWRSHNVPESIKAWVDQGKALGMQFCVISNTRNPERLKGICESLDIPFVRAKFKPSRDMYLAALAKFSLSPEKGVMIGDQLMTDIWGANRSGVDAIWVQPMASREFIGTRMISRNIERVIGRFLYKNFQVDSAEVLIAPERPGFFQHNLVKQFIKFCVVGGSSMVIDVGLHGFLMFVMPAGGEKFGTFFGKWLIESFPSVFAYASVPTEAAFPVLKVLTASLAILNGFYWNRRWTFEIRDNAERFAQLKKFAVVAVIGMILNTTITTFFNNIIAGHPTRSWAVATLIATVVVAFWNFTGQRFWTFREKQEK